MKKSEISHIIFHSDSFTSGSSLVEHRRRRYSFNEGN